MKFDFQFGKKKPEQKQIIIISVVLSAVVGTLSQCTGASQGALWDLLDEVQRSLFPGTVINDVLLKDPKIIERRVERDVDRAIREYERLTKDSEPPRVPLPRLSEKAPDDSESQRLLGGEMRICSPWLDDCPKD